MQSLSNHRAKLNEKIWRNFKKYFHNQILKEPALVRNLNYHVIPGQKKVLISYLTNGYYTDPKNNSGRTVILEIFKIIKVFSELGFSIDLVNCNDVKAIEIIRNSKYDLIFGFGEVFYLMSQIQPDAFTILYMTEQHPEISLREEQKRIDYFFARHKKHIPMVRSGRFYKIKHLEKRYSEVITMSETEPLFKEYNKPFTIFPSGIINPEFIFYEKNFLIARKNFLWFGSTAVIHKGLDLLIDVFSNRKDTYLHICGLNDQARKTLRIQKRDNIIDHGFVNISSATFLEIVKNCAYSILPSCAEGCATSITTSMVHGLIPVVIRDAGFNRLADNAIFLDDYKIDYIDTSVTRLANKDPEFLSLLSKKVFSFARREFTLTAFEENFKNILRDIFQ